MHESRWTTAEMAQAIRRIGRFEKPTAPNLEREIGVRDVTAREDDVLVTFRWKRYPWLLAIGFGPESEYDEYPDTVDAWASDALTYLAELTGTGIVVGAARKIREGGVIELLERQAWDRRFYLSIVPPDGEAWGALKFFERDGFDTTRVQELRASGDLISWNRVYVNNSTGSPYVGHAAVVRVSDTRAEIDFCETVPGLPVTVGLNLCEVLAHEAAWTGITEVVTDIDRPELDLLGFKPEGERRVLTTDFLAVDHAEIARLIASSDDWVPPPPRRLSPGTIRVAG